MSCGAAGASVTILASTLPFSLHEPAVAFDGQWIWLFGGLTSTGQFSDAVMKFDPVSETLQTTALRLPHARQAAAAIDFGGVIYLFGGRRTASVLETQILRFDPQTGVFTPMTTTLPTGRYNMAVAANANSILLFGGYDYNAVDDALVYDPANDMLTTLPASLSPARESPVAVPYGNNIFLAGGSTVSTFLTRIDRFDLTNGSITPTTTVLPGPAWQPAPMLINGISYLYGGNGVFTVSCFDPASMQSVLVPGVSIPHVHMGRGSIGLPGRGYVFGGSNSIGTQMFDTIIRFVP